MPPCWLYSGTAVADDLVQPGDNPLKRAAVLRVDVRIAIGGDDIPGDDHVRLAEEHDDVAVAVRGRHVPHLDRLAAEPEVLPRGEKRVGRPVGDFARRALARRSAHPVHHVLKGDQACAVAEERAAPASWRGDTALRDRGDACLSRWFRCLPV